MGKSLAGCFIFFIAAIEVSSWDVPYGDIPLEIGSNEITVTARDSLGNSGSDLITIRRREIPLPDPTEGLQFNYFEDSAGAANFVNLQYRSVWDVHSPSDSAMTSQAGFFKNGQILADLAHYIVPTDYDFVLFYSLTELPGWITLVGPCSYAAKNIGFDNSLVGTDFCPTLPPGWTRLRGFPHMNTIAYIEKYRDSPFGPWELLTPVNRMGQAWGVYWVHNAISLINWTPEDPVTDLASNGRYWTSFHHWFDENLPGILHSTPNGEQFNAFDLYAMGLMDYEEAKNYQYLVHNTFDESTLYPITVDDLIERLRLSGDRYFQGDGKHCCGLFE